MKPLIFALGVVFAFGGVRAQTPAWQPSRGHTQIPIWPGAVPDAQPVAGTEVTATAKNLVAGRPWDYMENVSRPTMTVYSPTGRNTGTAVVVFPGGGYQILAIDLEGTEVCDWLTSKGITCVLSKYRVPNSGMHWDKGCQCQLKPKAPTSLEDALGLPPFAVDEKLAIVELRGGTHLPLFEVGLAGEDVAESLTGQFHERLSERFDLMIKGKGMDELKKYRLELISRGIAAGEIPDESFFGHHLFCIKDPDGNGITIYTSHVI
jgi:hypothetical protein